MIIFYHEAERELQNAYLLKEELIRRGHEAYVYQYDYLRDTKQVLFYSPDVIITHCLHQPKTVKNFTKLFQNKIPRIVSLQYEQLLTKAWQDSKFHIPQNVERNGIHLCWSEYGKNRLVENGVDEENAVVVGSLGVDLDRKEFGSIYESKAEVAERFGIKDDKKWILFISSFTMAALNNESIKQLYSSRIGAENAAEFFEISDKSKKIILKWIEEYIKDNKDCEFIYRPHPFEISRYNDLTSLNELEETYENFHIIREDSIRSWIHVCDKINTWISTSIVDVYFMEKNCSILRPVDIPQHLDHEIMIESDKVTSYEDFYKFNKFDNVNKFPINKEVINKYYLVDNDKYAYQKICDLLEEIVDKGIVMDFYKS